MLPKTVVGADSQQGIEVYFSPNGGATRAVTDALWEAKKRVYVQAHILSSKVIADSLAVLKRRGIELVIVLDRDMAMSPYSQVGFLFSVGVPVYLDGRHAVAHGRAIVVDGKTVVAGSYDLTDYSENDNAEDLIVIRGNLTIAGKFIANIEEHLSHSEMFSGGF